MVTVLRRLFGSLTPSSRYAAARDEIRALEKLKSGWNSYEAPEISARAIDHALEIVDLAERRGAPAPSSSPLPSGGVALAWETRGLEIQISIDDESVDYSVARRGDPKLVEQSSLDKPHDVQRLIDKYLAA